MSSFEPMELPEEALPPQDVRLIEARIEPWPDRRKVRVHLTLTPFSTRPNLYAVVHDTEGNEVCSAHVIETMDSRMVFTLHLRGESQDGKYILDVEVFYEDIGAVDHRSVDFEIHPLE